MYWVQYGKKQEARAIEERFVGMLPLFALISNINLKYLQDQKFVPMMLLEKTMNLKQPSEKEKVVRTGKGKQPTESSRWRWKLHLKKVANRVSGVEEWRKLNKIDLSTPYHLYIWKKVKMQYHSARMHLGQLANECIRQYKIEQKSEITSSI